MSHFAYIRPSGVWNGGIPVLHGELTQLDQNLFKALNADDGGSWAPSSIINIGGAGVTGRFVGASTVDGASAQLTFQNGASLYQNPGSVAYLSGNVVFLPSSVLTVDGTAAFASGSATSFASGSTLTLSGATTINGSLQTYGTCTFGPGGVLAALCITELAGSTTISGSLLVSSSNPTFVNPVLLSGGAVLNGASTLRAPLLALSAGRVTKRVKFFSSTSSDGSFGPAQWDRVLVWGLTTNVTFTIDDTGAVDGDEMVFVNNNAGFHVTLSTPFGGTIATLVCVKGQPRAVTVIRTGGSWIVMLQEIF